MVICQPRNGQVLVDMLKSAFSWQRPVAIRYPNLLTQEESQPYRQRELGVSEVLQEGSKVAIIALGHMCTTALEVAKRFTEQQITPTVIDPIFIKPIDADMLYKILSTHQYIVTIEEHALTVGLGSIVNNFIVRNGFNNVLVANFGIPEVFVDHGSNAELLKEHGLSADKILEKCVDIFNMQHKLENMDTYL
jgi:1-deoxy-D-xylulose-5-phosphate synthase